MAFDGSGQRDFDSGGVLTAIGPLALDRSRRAAPDLDPGIELGADRDRPARRRWRRPADRARDDDPVRDRGGLRPALAARLLDRPRVLATNRRSTSPRSTAPAAARCRSKTGNRKRAWRSTTRTGGSTGVAKGAIRSANLDGSERRHRPHRPRHGRRTEGAGDRRSDRHDLLGEPQSATRSPSPSWTAAVPARSTSPGRCPGIRSQLVLLVAPRNVGRAGRHRGARARRDPHLLGRRMGARPAAGEPLRRGDLARLWVDARRGADLGRRRRDAHRPRRRRPPTAAR